MVWWSELFEGKKILILDLIVFFFSFIFVFLIIRSNPFFFLMMRIAEFPITLFHEFGHCFICAISGGFPIIVPGFLEGHFLPMITLCNFLNMMPNPFLLSIETIFGHVFNCIAIFLLFYFAAATNEKHWNNLFLSFFVSIYAWMAVDHLHEQLYRDYFLHIEDIPKFATFWGITTDTVVTLLASLSIILVIIALRYGLEEEQKSGKINTINLEILPLEIAYADLFKLLFFIACVFIGVTVFVLIMQPNLTGVILGLLILGFTIYFHTVYKVGNKFRYIIANVKTNLVEVKTSFSFLSAVFQCTTQKNIVLSIAYDKKFWIINVPSKNVSVKLPAFTKAGDIAKRINRIFSYHKLG